MAGRSTFILAAAVVLLTFIGGAAAFTFTLPAGSRKCFTEDLTSTQRVSVMYKMAKSLSSFVAVSVTGPKGQRLLEHFKAKPESTTMLQPQSSGEHTICFKSSMRAQLSASAEEVTLELKPEHEVQREEEAKRYAANQAVRNPAMDQAAYLEQTVKAIHREYEALKDREAQMRNTNESTNARSFYFTLMGVIVVVVASALRHYKLRRYLIQKKILD